MVAVVGPAAQRRCSSRLLSSGSAPLQHAHRSGRSLITRGWTANLVDAWCSQATLHGHERLYPARRYPCASAVRVWPTVDAVPCAVNRLNMVRANTTYGKPLRELVQVLR